MIKIHKIINGKICTSSRQLSNELNDWLTSKGLNPSKFVNAYQPVFLIYYINDNQQRLTQAVCVDEYDITNVNLKELSACEYIYIFKDFTANDNVFRIYPVISGSYYKIWLRSKKLERVLNDN